jgi:hypothetical protein
MNSAEGFREYLLDEHGFGLLTENLLYLFDAAQGPHDIIGSISLFLRERIARQQEQDEPARDVIVYYVGHGGFANPTSDYFLALRTTQRPDLYLSSLPITSLAIALKEETRHLRRYIILDSCFSAAAYKNFQSSSPVQIAMLKTESVFPPSGTALLCSAGPRDPSKAPPGRTFTMFTGALLDVLRHGDATPVERFSLRDMASLIRYRLRQEYEDDAVRPEVHSPEQARGNVAEVPLFPNPVRRTVMPSSTEEKSIQRPCVFISYKRHVELDEKLALEIFNALKVQYDVFIDQAMPVGTRWGAHIEEKIRQTNFFIVLLSAESVQSEMVLAEIAMAHELSKEQDGRLTILPIRLVYREPLRYPLSAYLDQINSTFWKSEEDTPRLIEELRDVIGRNRPLPPPLPPDPSPPVPPAQMDVPGGIVDPESSFYIERQSDRFALETVKREGMTIVIKGPRHMGKSSLLIRITNAAAKIGKQVASLDFGLIDKMALSDANTFFRQFCSWITDELNMEDQVDEYWRIALGHSQLCTRYVSRYLLRNLDGPLVLAMDEVDMLFGVAFQDDFFSMLRSWHDSRGFNPTWKKLDLVLVTSTEPYLFIDDVHRSPFNVGEITELNDFTLEQVVNLNQLYGTPLSSVQQEHLMVLLDGHPYLVHRALYLVASRRISIADLFNHAADDRGPFGDHLRYYFFRLHDQQDLIDGLRQVINRNERLDQRLFHRLHGAGLVKRVGGNVVPRCQLYAQYFSEHLRG